MRKKLLLTVVFAFVLAMSTACLDGETNSLVNSIPSTESQTDESVSSPNGETGDNSSTDPNEGGTEKETYCLVTFDSDGGSAVAAVTVKKGDRLTEPAAPEKSAKEGEYKFLGWFYGDKAWDFTMETVTEDMTLTAKWKLESSYTNPFLPKD